MRFYLERELKTLGKEGVRLRLIGDHSAFGGELVERLESAVERTAANDRVTLVVALNYGSRAEIAGAARQLATRSAPAKSTRKRSTRPARGRAQTADLPDLDLLIRTSGEVRLSNFLLWQAAYAELLFLDTFGPTSTRRAFATRSMVFARRATGASGAGERTSPRP